MADANVVKEWFDIADTELASAKYLTDMRHPSPDAVICYLCQQSAEKYLKGYLVLNDIDPPKIHNLLELSRLCESIHTDFSLFSAKHSFLNQYGVMPRYPNELQITPNDVKIALRYANDIQQFVLSLKKNYETNITS
jgi:HEPN domain-containing protein